MHFSRAFVAAAAAYLLPLAHAQDNQEPMMNYEKAVVNVKRPAFVPTNVTAPFLEQFTAGWEARWKASNAKKSVDASTEEDWQYIGEWAVEEPVVFKGIEGDKGLVVKDKAAHHAISAKFPKQIDPKGKDLVVQYEVKLQDGLECGGAYLKLLRENAALHAEEFSNASPYVIMFGPDKCGSTNKVHFIFNHKNPKTGVYEEKHMSNHVSMKNEKTSTLYRLHVKPDQSFEIEIDGENQVKGSLLEDFLPAVNPPEEIEDPDDKKPEDWVDQAKIPDPDATKPDDWDENAPLQIVDEDAEKPEDWLEDEPNMIPDPEAEKPEDWDDEEDGDWQPPMVPNPKCAEVSGCGPWTKPLKKNPDYKGKWTSPMIDNPLYKGVWSPRKIANPAFFEDKNPARFEPMGGVGFELWTMQKDILFDNIYVGHSVEDADTLKAQTYDVKKPVEKEIEEAEAPQKVEKEEKKSPLDRKFTEDPVKYIKDKAELFVDIAKRDPLEAVKVVPEIAGGIGLLLITVIALILGGVGAGAQSPKVQDAAKKAKASAVEAKDKTSEAVSTGAEKVQAEVNKRTTRSNKEDQ